jgi:hypothetical protein
VFPNQLLTTYAEACKTAAGFFWKSGWAFVLGYFISAMIQAFVPRGRLTPYIGNPRPRSLGLATVLNANGVLFAGIMGFIYSDLMVPPLVAVNAKYYGWKTAVYIAIIMYVSIVLTAITLHYAFAVLDVMPTSARKVEAVAQFNIDYSFWMNIIAVLLAGTLGFCHHRYKQIKDMDAKNASEGLSLKKIATYLTLLILAGGFGALLLH